MKHIYSGHRKRLRWVIEALPCFMVWRNQVGSLLLKIRSNNPLVAPILRMDVAVLAVGSNLVDSHKLKLSTVQHQLRHRVDIVHAGRVENFYELMHYIKPNRMGNTQVASDGIAPQFGDFPAYNVIQAQLFLKMASPWKPLL